MARGEGGHGFAGFEAIGTEGGLWVGSRVSRGE